MASRPPRKTPLAGGMLIALGAMIGPAVGFHYHQTTIGFLIGVGVAVVVAVLIWLVNRASA